MSKKRARPSNTRKFAHVSAVDHFRFLPHNDVTSPFTDTTTSSTSTMKVFVFGSGISSSQTLCDPNIPSGNATTATLTSTATAPATPLFTFESSYNSYTKNSTAAISLPLVVSRGPQIYPFPTVLDSVEKMTATSPSQMNAALITPSLNARRQKQIVTYTSFRIDNILPSTYYTELPEQARMELDELDYYIRKEYQISDYLVNQATPIRQQTMKGIQHEQEMMHYKLNALSDSVQLQLNAVKELIKSLSQQVVHFCHAQVVIELCKSVGGEGSTWQTFEYDDQYIINLSTRLTARLDEFKKCVDDIGMTTDSWVNNQVQYPQDLSRIIRTQNETFLALVNQVATLHERLTGEQELFKHILTIV